MITFFIADLHLQIEKPIVYSNFLRFLRHEASTADALYILGDLFETWIGDDDQNQLYYETAIAIKTLVQSGVPCFFIHGNHDFLVDKNFARDSGIIFLPEEKVLNLYGRRMLIMHGDTLCTSDISYQIFRASIHIPLIKMLFLALPLFIRNYIFTRIRKNIEIVNNIKPVSITNVNLQEVVKAMKKHHVQWLIHGHTHRPKVHKLTINNEPAFRIVLGHWEDTSLIAKVTPQNVELVNF